MAGTNLFDILEDRMQQLFEGNRMLSPLPFKKLARSAVHEMKRCSVRLNGHRIAPALYTILVNEADDRTMAPLYQEVTDELVDFLTHEAANAGLELEAAPVVRFIAEPNIKLGRPDVIAEAVTPDVLEEIRQEESAYALKHAGRKPAAADGSAGANVMLRHPGATGGAAGISARQPHPAEQDVLRPRATPAPRQPRSAGFIDDKLDVRALQEQAGFAPVPATVASVPAQAEEAPLPTPALAATCQLTDNASGRTWRIGVDRTVIGREESTADLILPDTNVSRRHAELVRTPSGWTLTDLGSTNGTRVNGQRVTSAELADGDVISLGVMQLSFQEL